VFPNITKLIESKKHLFVIPCLNAYGFVTNQEGIEVGTEQQGRYGGMNVYVENYNDPKNKNNIKNRKMGYTKDIGSSIQLVLTSSTRESLEDLASFINDD